MAMKMAMYIALLSAVSCGRDSGRAIALAWARNYGCVMGRATALHSAVSYGNDNVKGHSITLGGGLWLLKWQA